MPTRIKKPRLNRTRPIRSWPAFLGASATGTDNARSGDGSGSSRADGAMNDVVARSVDLGYRVIDEYIQQGQKAARRWAQQSFAPEALGDDTQELARRMTRFATDFGSLWFEAWQLALGQGPPAPGRETDSSASLPQPPSPPPTGEERPPIRLRILVSSPYPTEVMVDWLPHPVARHLRVQSLRAIDSNRQLSDVKLEAAKGDEPYRLRVRVPRGQPAGVYNGMIIDEDTNRPAGTMSLRILRK